MPLLGQRLLKRGSGQTAEVTDWLTRVQATGATVGATQLTAINAFSAALAGKSYNSKIKEIGLFFGASTLTGMLQKLRYVNYSAYINNSFASGNYTATGGSAGLQGSTAPTKYLDSQETLTSIGATTRNVSISLFFKTKESGTNLIAGILVDPSNRLVIGGSVTAGNLTWDPGSISGRIDVSYSTGTLTTCASGNPSAYTYTDGTQTGTNTSYSSSLSNNLYIFSASGSSAFFSTNAKIAYYSLATYLTQSEVSDYSSLVDTMISAI